MLFSSLIFLVVFLPCVLFIYYAVLRRHRHLQNCFLLIASLGFYAWGEPWFVLVMFLSICCNYGFGLLVDRFRQDRKKAKAVISLSLVFNLGIIFIFKYLMFTLENLNALLHSDFTVPEIALPIGISFFTFQAISYVIDVYREKGQVQRNLLNVGLYISFFPQLIAGPIIRYEVVSDQIMNRRETWDDFAIGVSRFLVGLAKKGLLANAFAVVADKAFAVATTDYCSVSFAWMGAIAYTLQIYYDFSGYSDMAIGLGRMFGFHFPENFNYPYISKSCSEFWRRWHISLGSWFRDYVYISLGGSRVASKGRLVFNLLVVWFLTGLWHGANWTFICWGLMYFILISIEKLTGWEKRLSQINDKRVNAIAHVYTMLMVILGWVFFRAETIGDALTYISIMFGNSDVAFFDKFFIGFLRENAVYFFFGLLFCAPVAKKIRAAAQARTKESNPLVCTLYALLLIGGLLVTMAYLIKGAYNPFIYFNF